MIKIIYKEKEEDCYSDFGHNLDLEINIEDDDASSHKAIFAIMRALEVAGYSVNTETLLTAAEEYASYYEQWDLFDNFLKDKNLNK